MGESRLQGTTSPMNPTNPNYNPAYYSQSMTPQHGNGSQEYFQQLSTSQEKNGNRFVDYAENKDKRVRDLIDKRFDGGQSFYKASDDFLRHKGINSSTVNNILKDQI